MIKFKKKDFKLVTINIIICIFLEFYKLYALIFGKVLKFLYKK